MNERELHEMFEQFDTATNHNHERGEDAEPETFELVTVTIEEFAAVDEPGARAIVGDDDHILIAENSDAMAYGRGGGGKTTLTVDLAVHIAAGDTWLGWPIPTPKRVLLIENEGPRPLFRAKLRHKLAEWTGSPLDGRVRVVEAPWARVSFKSKACQAALAGAIREHEADVVIAGPLTRLGMDEAGTLQQVTDFLGLVALIREQAGRAVTVILVHHENKGGTVRGAWEQSGDTLLHVQGQGHGRTRLHAEKARWASDHHGKTLNLVWTDGDGFVIDETGEVTDEEIAERILEYIGEHPRTGWTNVDKGGHGTGRTVPERPRRPVRITTDHEHRHRPNRPKGSDIQVRAEEAAPTLFDDGPDDSALLW
jgi:hypothetical protein